MLPHGRTMWANNPSGKKRALLPPPFTQGRLLSTPLCPYCAAGSRAYNKKHLIRRASPTPSPQGEGISVRSFRILVLRRRRYQICICRDMRAANTR